MYKQLTLKGKGRTNGFLLIFPVRPVTGVTGVTGVNLQICRILCYSNHYSNKHLCKYLNLVIIGVSKIINLCTLCCITKVTSLKFFQGSCKLTLNLLVPTTVGARINP